MRFFKTTVVVLVGAVGAVKITKHDKLAALGLVNVGKDVANNGYPSPGTCTLETVKIRKEWYVSFVEITWHRLTWP
jgi:tyrosinase